MANNYQQFSSIIPYANAERREWLKAALEAKDESEGPCCSYEIPESDKADAVWVYAEECGNIDVLVGLVAEYQKQFHLAEPWVLTWADWCEKMRVDEFSGGAVAVYRGKVKWCIPSQFAQRWIGQQEKRRA